MSKSKAWKFAKKTCPDSKITRVAWFTKDNSGNSDAVLIHGYDENVAMVISGKDLKTLLSLLPLDPVIDKIRVIKGQKI